MMIDRLEVMWLTLAVIGLETDELLIYPRCVRGSPGIAIWRVLLRHSAQLHDLSEWRCRRNLLRLLTR
jgi:hypothetical protein